MKRRVMLVAIALVMLLTGATGVAFAASTYYETRTFDKYCVSFGTNTKYVQCKSYVSSVTKNNKSDTWYTIKKVNDKSKAVQIRIKGDNLSGKKLKGKATAKDNKGNKYIITIQVSK